MVDAITFGPIFDTKSKRGLVTPRGFELLRAVVRSSRVPVTAIGGIDTSNVEAVLGTGVHAVAAISQFQRPEGVRAFLAACDAEVES